MMIYRIDNAVEVVQLGTRMLSDITEDGGFICEDSLSEVRLMQAETNLRLAADQVKARREALRKNEPMLQAAE